MTGYADPRVLVSTEWVAEHLDDPAVTVVEVDIDTAAYERAHIPGAVVWNWGTQLRDWERRDILSLSALEDLLGKSGITPQTTVVLYGGDNNAFAAWAFWALEVYGHRDTRLMNGGRKKWIAEKRKMVGGAAPCRRTHYETTALNPALRAFLPQVKSAVKSRSAALVDVRSEDEFTGKLLAPRGVPRASDRGGHIPRARCVPWSLACNPDGTFKSAGELRALYESKGITPDKDVITYCRAGDRSPHTWFVLKHLLGYPSVRNYDGSWAEWGNVVGTAVETGDGSAP